jgi:hypothetical protein
MKGSKNNCRPNCSGLFDKKDFKLKTLITQSTERAGSLRIKNGGIAFLSEPCSSFFLEVNRLGHRPVSHKSTL